MTDAFKLVLCEKLLHKKFRKILLFADDNAKQYFSGIKWQAKCLREYEIEIVALPLPFGLLNKVEKAQKRQYR